MQENLKYYLNQLLLQALEISLSISKDKVFRKFHLLNRFKFEKEESKKVIIHRCNILKDDIIEVYNNNVIVQGLGEKIASQEEI